MMFANVKALLEQAKRAALEGNSDLAASKIAELEKIVKSIEDLSKR